MFMIQTAAALPSVVEQTPMSRGIVVVHTPGGLYTCRHERATRAELAKRLAALKGFDFAGELDLPMPHPGPIYLVPADTLVGVEAAAALGIRGEHDLFGGVVPRAFVATKAITHPLVEPDALAPAGWSHEFGRRVRDVVLRGFTAFTPEDARHAGLRLLRHGPVRLKSVRATAGRGQAVVSSTAELEAALAAVDTAELSGHGLVLEEDLAAEVTTYSVGQVRVADLVATYYGTQRLMPDNGGTSVYGGSDLVVARGDFEALLALDPPPRRLGLRWRRRAHTMPPRWSASRDCSRRAATTMSREAWTPPGACARARWSSPGGRVAPAAPRSRRWRPSAPIRTCGPFAPRPSSSTLRARCRCRRTRPCTSAAWTSGSAP